MRLSGLQKQIEAMQQEKEKERQEPVTPLTVKALKRKSQKRSENLLQPPLIDGFFFVKSKEIQSCNEVPSSST